VNHLIERETHSIQGFYVSVVLKLLLFFTLYSGLSVTIWSH